MKKIDRTGEENVSNQGYLMRIIDYTNSHNIKVQFQDTNNAVIKTQYTCFKSGKVNNPYHPTLYNIGYIGSDELQTIDINGHYLPSYTVWNSMLKRCYDGKYSILHRTYMNCIVCDEWHSFQNFNNWYNDNIYNVNDEIMNLDKDILYKGNKIYSPETCIFVPKSINVLFTKCDASRIDNIIGTQYKERINKYIARCNTGKKRIHIGTYNTEIEAFQAYKIVKEKHIKQVADKYKDKIPQKLYDAMYRYEVEITD